VCRSFVPRRSGNPPPCSGRWSTPRRQERRIMPAMVRVPPQTLGSPTRFKNPPFIERLCKYNEIEFPLLAMKSRLLPQSRYPVAITVPQKVELTTEARMQVHCWRRSDWRLDPAGDVFGTGFLRITNRCRPSGECSRLSAQRSGACAFVL
jgi:hypothetical protein